MEEVKTPREGRPAKIGRGVQIASLSLAVAILILFCWLSVGDTGDPAIVSPESQASIERDSESDLVPAPLDANARGTESPFELRVLVTDESGSPLSGAACYAIRNGSSQRTLGRNLPPLATSAEDGVVSICTDEIAPEHGLLFSRREYMSTWVDEPAALKAHPVVILARGHLVTFKCTTSRGEPLKGAVVTLSMTALPGEPGPELNPSQSPGWPNAIAVHEIETDQDGMARVSGLEAGRFHFDCKRSGYVHVESSHASLVVVPEPNLVEIVLAPIFLFQCSIPGDEVLAQRFEFTESSGWRVPASLSGPLIAARERAQALHPNALVAAAASMRNEPGTTAPLSVILKQGGPKDYEIPGFPIDSESAVLELEAPGADGIARLETWISVIDAGGRQLDPRDFYVSDGGLPGSDFWFVPDLEGRLWLPAGDHELRTLAKTLRSRYQPGTIRAGEYNVVEIMDRLRTCALEYQFAWGEMAANVHWQLAWQDRSYEAFSFMARPLEVLLPPGRLAVTAKVFGRTPVQRMVEIPPLPVDEVFPIEISEQSP